MNLIELQNVSKEIKHQQLLHEINAGFANNSISTLQGINGSGKTLILKAILGLITVNGTVTVNGKLVKVTDPYPLKAGILIENPSLIEDFTAYRNLELLAKLDPRINLQEIDKLLTDFDLAQVPKQKVKKFSLGMKQKLGIAQAFLGSYPLIVLDEPTNALDQDSIQKLIALIHDYNQKGVTFIIASHDQNFVDEVATQKFLVKEGTILNET